MILIGFDIGRKKTGIAIGNQHTGTARPLAIIYGGRSRQLSAIGDHIRTWQPQMAVIGLPCHMDGAAHSMTRFCQHFAKLIHHNFNLPIEFFDERLTTSVARFSQCDERRKHGEIDDIAASIILQDFLSQPPTQRNGDIHPPQFLSK